MKYKKTILLFVSLVVFVFFLSGTVTAQDAPQKDGWQFYADLYGWMPNIYGESATGSDFEIDLDDILDNLQFMVMVVGGVKKDKWEFNVDVIYMDLEGDKNSTAYLLNLPVNVYADVELKAWVVTPTVRYNILEKDKFKLNILAGARYLYLDVDLKVDIDGVRDNEFSKSASDSGDVWDAIVGVTGEVMLNEKWYLPFQFDIGTGDSDLTYQAFGGVGYRFSRVDLIGGYRYLRWNFDDNSALDDLYISGPIAGVKIRF